MPSISDLRQRQALPLSAKVSMSLSRIREWYNHWDGDVYVSFSGGKDSTVLAHLVHYLYPNVPLVFSNTGLEYPEIQSFARENGAEFVKPKMMFSEVISKYGYPIIGKETAFTIHYARAIRNSNDAKKYSNLKRNELKGKREFKDNKRKHLLGKDEFSGKSLFNKEKYLPLCSETHFLIDARCCNVMKKMPLKKYAHNTGKKPYIGSLTEESKIRELKWLQNGCNAFNTKEPVSNPLSFWTEQDILKYIKQEGLKIAKVYGDIVSIDKNNFEYEPMPGVECKLKCSGCERTGCIFCGFGVHLEKGETRFQKLAKTHPRQYEYCMSGGQWVDNPKYDPAAPKMDGDWVNWNPKKIWVPSKEGLGMKHVFDECNQIYGKDFIRYE